MKLGSMFKVVTGAVLTMGLVMGLSIGSLASDYGTTGTGGQIVITIQDEFGNLVEGATLRYKTAAMSTTQTITVTGSQVTLGGTGTPLDTGANSTWQTLDAYSSTKGYLLTSANVALAGSAYNYNGTNTDQTIGMKYAFKVTVVNDDGQPIYSAASITSTYNTTSVTTSATQQSGTNIYGVAISLNVGTVTINSSGLGSAGYLASAYVASTAPADVTSAQVTVRVTSNYTFKINSLKNEYGVTLSSSTILSGGTISVNVVYINPASGQVVKVDGVPFETVSSSYGFAVPTQSEGIPAIIRVNATGYMVSKNTNNDWTSSQVTRDFSLQFPVKVTNVFDELGLTINVFNSTITSNAVNIIVGGTTYAGTINASTGSRLEWGIPVPVNSVAATLQMTVSPNHFYLRSYSKAITVGDSNFADGGTQATETTALEFATKIKMQNELGVTLNLESASASINIIVGELASFIVTGSGTSGTAEYMVTGSAYFREGVVYMLVSPNLIGTGNIGVTANRIGYLKYSTAQSSVTDNTSTTFTLANKFPIKIMSVESEAGSTITPSSNDVVRVATANSPLPYTFDSKIAAISSFNVASNTWYISVTNNTAELTFNVRYLARGYLWTTDNINVTISAQSADNPTQQVVTFTKANGDGLRYPIKVSYAQDQLGITLSASALYFTAAQASADYTAVDSSLDIIATVASGSEVVFVAVAPSDNNVETYVATPSNGAASGPVTFNAFSNGYVMSTILIPTSSSGSYPISVTGDQIVVSFSAAASKGLNYNLVISSRNIYTELGITINPTLTDASSGYPFAIYTTANVAITPLAASFNQTNSVWLVAVPTQTIKYTYDTTKFILSGYTATFDVSDTTQHSSSRATLNYPIKITLSNELGVSLGVQTEGFTVTAVGATIASSDQILYVSATQNEDIAIAITSGNYVHVTANLKVPASEYVNAFVASGNETSLGEFSDYIGSNGSNGVITYVKGIKYPLRVQVSDELGNPLNGTYLLNMVLGNSSVAVSKDNSFYFNVVATNQTLTVNMKGFVVAKAKTVTTNNSGQTRIVLSGNSLDYLFATPVNQGTTSGEGLTYARGLDYTAKVQQITDKFGNEIKIDSAVSASVVDGDLVLVTSNVSDGAFYLALEYNLATVTTSVTYVTSGSATFVASGNVALKRYGFIQTTQNVTIGGGSAGTNGKVESLTYIATNPSLDVRLNSATYSPQRVLFYRWKHDTYTDSYITSQNSNLIGEEVSSRKGLEYAVSINANLIQNQLGSVIGGLITPNASNASLTIFNSSINITVYSVSGSILTALTRDYDMADGFSGYYVTTNIYSYYPTNLTPYPPYTNLGWYVAVSGTGNHKVRMSGFPGYVGTDSAELTVTYNTAQQEASYNGSATGLKHSLVADVRTTVTSNTTRIVDGTVKLMYTDGTSLNATYDAGSLMFYMAATKNGTLMVTHNHYTDTQLENFNYSTVTQTVVVFSGANNAAPSSVSGESRVTVNGLAYPVSILLKDELGTVITADTIVITRDSTQYTAVNYDGAYYFYGKLGVIPTAGTLVVSKTGYVTVRSSKNGIGIPLTNATTNRTTAITLTGRNGTDLSTVAAGDTVERNGFPYALKVVLYDEVGDAVTADAITYGGTAAAASSNNTYYFAATATQNLLITKTGFVSISQNSTSPQLGAGIAGQTVLTLTGTASTELTDGATINVGATETRNGLKYGVKVTAAGPSDSGATGYSFTLDGTTYNAKAVITGITTKYSGGVAYLPATTGTLSLTKVGYTTVTTTNIASTTTTQNVFSFTGTANGLAGRAELGLTNTLPSVEGLTSEGRILQGGTVTVTVQVANYGPYAVSVDRAMLAFNVAEGTTGVTSDYTVTLPVTSNFSASTNPSVVNTNDYVFRVDVGGSATTDVIEVKHIIDATQVSSASVQAGWLVGQSIANSEFPIGTWRVVTDVTKPTVTLTSPGSGSTVNSTVVNLRGTAADNEGLTKVWVYVGGTANAMTLVSSGNGVLSTEWYGQVAITSNSTLTIYAYDATDLPSEALSATLLTGEQTVSDVSSIAGLKVVLPLSSTGETVTVSAENLSSSTISTSSATAVTVRGITYYIPPKPTAEATRNVLTMIDIVANNGSVATFNTTINLQIPFSGQASDVAAVYYTGLTTNSSVANTAWTLVPVSDYSVIAGTVSVSTNHFTIWMISGTASSDVTTPTVGAITVGGVALDGATIATQLPTFVVSGISDNVGITTSSVRYTVDNVVVASGSAVTFAGGQASFTMVTTLNEGAHTVHFSLSDTSGNSVTESATFNVTLAIADGSVYNYPNPVRDGVTTINFTLSSAKDVNVYIYNAIGEMVKHNTITGVAGVNSWKWYVDDAYGYQLANGLYFVHVLSGSSLVGKAKVLIVNN